MAIWSNEMAMKTIESKCDVMKSIEMLCDGTDSKSIELLRIAKEQMGINWLRKVLLGDGLARTRFVCNRTGMYKRFYEYTRLTTEWGSTDWVSSGMVQHSLAKQWELQTY